MSSVSDPKSAKSGPGRPGSGGSSRGDGRGRTPAGRDDEAPREDADPWEEEAPPHGESAGFFPDLLRRGLTLGFTGVFMTEEAVRRALGDSVPRDLIEYFVAQSDRTRAELLDRLSREFGRVLSSLDPAEVARRLLEGRTVEVKASFRLVPDPRAKARTRGGEDAPADAAGDDDESEHTGGSVSRPRRERR